MRYVDTSHLPRLAQVDPLDNAAAEISGLADAEQRSAYIDARADLWGTLRTALWGLGSCKCWFSEAILQHQQGHVEHYRPKKKVAATAHPGYWWDAFDWKNFRFAHPTVNLRVTDYLTGKLAGKGTYFPLRNQDARANSKAEEIHEEPVLLDPTRAADCRLLCFDSANGRARPRFSEGADAWKHRRAQASIEYYHLNEPTWTVQRKDLMDEVAAICDEAIAIKSEVPLDAHAYETCLARLVERIGPMSEFSAAAYQVTREKGLIEQLFPLPSSD